MVNAKRKGVNPTRNMKNKTEDNRMSRIIGPKTAENKNHCRTNMQIISVLELAGLDEKPNLICFSSQKAGNNRNIKTGYFMNKANNS